MSPLIREARRMVLAVQFLTRVPTPTIEPFHEADLRAASRWFPLVGLLIGAVLAGVGTGLAILDPWLGALATLLVWAWITGALHLDGLADLTDGAGAAHRSPERRIEAMRDPHIGGMGAVALILVLLAKLVLLMLLLRADVWAGAAALLLIPAFARLGTLYWALAVPPLSDGMGERFAWSIPPSAIVVWWALLSVLAIPLAPPLLLAPLLEWLWAVYLLRRIGGMSGDGLGAGVEITETALLATVVIAMLLSGAST